MEVFFYSPLLLWLNWEALLIQDTGRVSVAVVAVVIVLLQHVEWSGWCQRLMLTHAKNPKSFGPTLKNHVTNVEFAKQSEFTYISMTSSLYHPPSTTNGPIPAFLQPSTRMNAITTLPITTMANRFLRHFCISSPYPHPLGSHLFLPGLSSGE